MARPTVDLEGLLRALCAHDIEFVIVGGAAAVLHGAPTTTQDLDIVPEQSEANLDRLMDMLLVGLDRDAARGELLVAPAVVEAAEDVERAEVELDLWRRKYFQVSQDELSRPGVGFFMGVEPDRIDAPPSLCVPSRIWRC